VAHSIDGVGSAVFPDASKSSHSICYEASRVVGYKCIREGIWGCFSSSEFRASKLTMLDNVMGMVLQVVDGDDASGTTKLSDTSIYGETVSPDCPPKGGFCSKFNKMGLQSSTITYSGLKQPLITMMPDYPHSIIHGGEAAWNAEV